MTRAKIFQGLILSCICTVLATPTGANAATAATVSVQPGVPQLFIDDGIIQSEKGLIRSLHQPVKDFDGLRPIIASPPGTSLLAYGSIVFDTKIQRHVMFVQEFPSRKMYRLLSADGMKWGDLELISMEVDLGDVPRDRAFNSAGNRELDLFSCYYDKTDPKYPYKGWGWLANWGNDLEGIFYMYSADGTYWKRGPQVVNGFAGEGDTSCRAIEQEGKVVYGPGDVTLFSWDEQNGKFLGIFKFFNHVGYGAGNNHRSRAYLWLDSLDEVVDTNRIERIALLPPNAYRNGDTPFDEYYASTAWRYGPLWLGTLKIFHPRGDYPHSSAGCAFLKLVVSRDALNWSKVPYLNDSGVPEVFIPNGPEGGNNNQADGGYISDFSTPPLRVGDEVIFYYSSSSTGKNHPREQILRGGGIFRARLKADRFVSVDEGSLTTKPLKFEGEELLVNSSGPVTVEVLGDNDELLGKAAVDGDSLAHLVRFDGQPAGQLIKNRIVRLHFTVERGSRLYSFTSR